MFSLWPPVPTRNKGVEEDYGLGKSVTSYTLSVIHGFRVEFIQNSIFSAWKKSSIVVRRAGQQTPTRTKVDKDWHTKSLAHFCTASQGKEFGFGHFDMTMSEPKVEILCERDLIMYFNITKLSFLDDDE